MDRVEQCTAVSALPVMEALEWLGKLIGHRQDAYREPEPLCCQLGRHDDTVRHGATVTTHEDRDLVGEWFDGQPMEFRITDPCGAENDDPFKPGCTLFGEHEGLHSWKVWDATGDMQTRMIIHISHGHGGTLDNCTACDKEFGPLEGA